MSTAIYWFRKALRLHDNPALHQLLQTSKFKSIVPVFVLDPVFTNSTLPSSPVLPKLLSPSNSSTSTSSSSSSSPPVPGAVAIGHEHMRGSGVGRPGALPFRFLVESLSDLDTSLRSVGSRLLVLRGSPESVLPALWKDAGASHLAFERDTEPYAQARDQLVRELAEADGLAVISQLGHTLYDPTALRKANKNKVPTTYSQLCKAARKVGKPPKPLPAPKSLPPVLWSPCTDEKTDQSQFSVPTLAELGFELADISPKMAAKRETTVKTERKVKQEPGHDQPSPNRKRKRALTASSHSSSAAHQGPRVTGGETQALANMKRWLEDKRAVRTFEKPKSSPTAFDPQSTTLLSPYLTFGCLSPRTFYYALQDVCAGGSHTQPPVSLHGQLLWREFFYTVGSLTANFDDMQGNPLCRQIPWDYVTAEELQKAQDTAAKHKAKKPKVKLETDNRKVSSFFAPRSRTKAPTVATAKTADEVEAAERLLAWKEGRTGFPWIDAAMTQLRTQGWIHHLARHAVACFLTRGDLWIHWKNGRDVFSEYLLDGDWSLNNGNWMWLSASAFFYQYHRVYSPETFAKKTDPSGAYVRHFLPQLRKFPDKYIYTPWKAPLSVQESCGCIIGTDYPAPIVSHKEASSANKTKMSEAYAAHKAANSK